MAKDKAPNNKVLTKRQASVINKKNKNISANLNTLMDTLHSMTYGVQRTDKVDALKTEFDSILKGEINSINRTSDSGDTTSFIAKLMSNNNKRAASLGKTLEDAFNTDEGQLESFLTDQYRNRLIKHADLHEVASQLTELQEAITVTRDAIISADVVAGHMSRTLKIGDDDEDSIEEDYIPIIEKMEKDFKLQEKVKNFIIPKSLEYGEYYVYCIPYSKLFEDFSKEKNTVMTGRNAYSAYSAITESTVLESTSSKKINDLVDKIAGHIRTIKPLDIFKNADLSKEVKAYLENVTVCNTAVPLPVLEEGIGSVREFYTEFAESTFNEKDTTSDKISFSNIMKGIDGLGVHNDNNASSMNKKTGGKKNESFANIKDCYIKMIDPTHLLPIEIMNEVIGYYYIQEEDITPLSGILTSTVYYDKYDNNSNENNILSSIAETIVASFDKKFLEKNIKFKKLIVEALNYFRLNNRKIKFQFIPKEYIIPFKINEDENGHGVSIIEPSLFYAKLYLMLLLFKFMSIILNSNDTKVNYIKQSGIEKNVANKIQEIARIRQERQVTLTDMFSYTTLVNKVGQGSEMYIPVGKSGERGIETEILSGQEVQINSDFMEMLKKAYISGTGVPDVLLNYLHEAEFAKTLELANNRFTGRVVSFQLDYNVQITELYKTIMRYSTTIPENIIESFSFNFIQPKSGNANITGELINNHNAFQEWAVNLFFGQDNQDETMMTRINDFKKKVAKEFLPMLDFAKLEEIYDEVKLNGVSDDLKSDSEGDENNGGDNGGGEAQPAEEETPEA